MLAPHTIASTPALNDATSLDSLRLRSEFIEMPGLVITVPQAARLLGVPVQRVVGLFEELAQEGFVIRTASGSYRRAYPASA